MRSHRLATVLAVIALPVMAWWSACELSDHADASLDDAYITYIYSRNLADGYGLRYNMVDDQPTEGYSSPLHVVLTAAAIRCRVDPLVFTRAMSLLMLWSIPFALALAARWIASAAPVPLAAVAALIGLILLCVPETIWHAATGMETLLFAGLCAWAFAYSVRAACSPRAFGIVAAVTGVVLLILLALARPEGAVLACGYLVLVPVARRMAGLTWSATQRRCYVVSAASWAVLFGAYVVWKWSYFGYLLPNPYYTKAHNLIFGSADHWLPGVSIVTQFLLFRCAPVIVVIVLAYRLGAGQAQPATDAPPPARRYAAGVLLALPSLAIVLMYARAIHEVAGGFRYEFAHWLPLLGLLAAALAIGRAPATRTVMTAFVLVLAARLVFSTPDTRALHRLRNPLGSTLAWTRQWNNHDPLGLVGLDLANTDLMSRGRVLLSGAGMTHYFSRFTALDWVGLNCNQLSGRKPLTIDQVWAVIDAFGPDVICSILPPATAGVTRRFDDPAFMSPSVRRTLRGRASELFKQWNPDRVGEMFYREMCYVRDHCEFGAAYSFGGIWGDDWALFAYVRRDSPHRDRIIRVLRGSTRADRTTDFAPYYINDPRLLTVARGS